MKHSSGEKIYSQAGMIDPGAVANNWTFLAVRYNANTQTAQITVNGTSFAPVTAIPGTGLNITYIGRHPSFDLPFVGRIDNVLFFDEYLSGSDLENFARNGIPAPVPEPSTFALVAGGLLIAASRIRRR